MKMKFRNNYIKKIEPFIGDTLIKVIVGQRRVGKSYLMMQIREILSRQVPSESIIYINKEDFEFDNIKNYVDLINFVENFDSRQNKKILFIDEIQEIEQFEKALRHFQSKGNYDIYCSGSNANLLSSELATLLAGRYIKIRVYSLLYSEFLDFHSLEDSNESFNKYMIIGGMPHLINLADDKSVVNEYHKNIFDSIILRDIIARYKIRNINLLQDLITFLSDNVGSLISSNKISEYLKSQKINIPVKTILEYNSYFESVFLIDKVKRADIIGKKIFEIGEKYYFEDIGIRNFLTSFQLKDIGKVLENIVYHHLKVMGYEVFIGKLNDKEIDFIAEKNDMRIYIQVAYLIKDEKTHNREFGNLMEINDNWRKIVVTMDELPPNNYKGIEQIHIRKFLMEFE